ncbi:MAG: peptide ABC transporter substrate-binding protein [Chloroflexota bacterium]
MPLDFPEFDWKTLSRLKPLALDRLCRRILEKSGKIIAQVRDGEHHKAYLDLYRHIHESDKVLADCFDTWSRSRALSNLINWRVENLLTEEEFAAFSADTRDKVEFFLRRG